MKVNNSLKIEDKVFSKEQIFLLFGSIYDEYKKNRAGSYRYVDIQLRCADNSRYNLDQNDGKFEENFERVLARKDIVAIEGTFYNSKKNKRININLKQGIGHFSSSGIEVTGGDDSWVDGRINYYSDLLGKVKNQQKYIGVLVKMLKLITSIIIGYAVILLYARLTAFVGYNSTADESFLFLLVSKFPVLVYPIMLVFSYFFGAIFTTFNSPLNYEWLERLYPSIEFEFTEVGSSKKGKMNTVLSNIFWSVLVPIVITRILSL